MINDRTRMLDVIRAQTNRRVPRSLPPAQLFRVNDTVRVQFPGDPTIHTATVVGMLPAQRGRRIALVRLARESGPRQDDFRAVCFAAPPGVEEWAEVAQMPQAMQAACFPTVAP